MTDKQDSKFLSLVLRHKPEVIGIRLDRNGWVCINDLLTALEGHGRDLDLDRLQHIVATNDKKRFEISADGNRIRARQGHSVEVELGYEPAEPPARLFHGTVAKYLSSIRAEGLTPGSRNHVHLSPDEKTAIAVGARRGKPIILIIDSQHMHDNGHLFYLTDNNVWLTGRVPAQYLSIPGSDQYHC